MIEAATVVEEQNSRDFALFGQEVNGSTWALARMNMFLHGKDSARIEWGDTNNSPALVEADRLMRFNGVVANPPFSHPASAEEIALNDFNLNIPRYVDTFEEEEIDVAAVELDIERLEAELTEVRVRMKAYLQELGL